MNKSTIAVAASPPLQISPTATTRPTAGWTMWFWRFFLSSAIVSLLAGTLVALSLVWGDWKTGLPLQILGTATTVLFAAAMGLLATYTSSSAAQRPATQALYMLALVVIGVATWACIQAIWFEVHLIVPARALATSMILFPATLALLKLTTMCSRGPAG